jgi:hypothetical protein
MQLSICWPRRACGEPADPHLELLLSVLAAARRTAFYGNGHRLRMLEAEDAAAARLPLRQILNLLPVVRLAEFLGARGKFRNAAAPGRLFRSEGVAAVHSGWRGRLGFHPEAVEGTAVALLRFRSSARRASRLLVNTMLGEPLLAAPVRDGLWNVFELPVFERLRGFDGEIFAAECDLHEGLHLDPAVCVFEHLQSELVLTSLRARRYPVLRLATGLTGAIDCCPCGRDGPRFLPAP